MRQNVDAAASAPPHYSSSSRSARKSKRPSAGSIAGSILTAVVSGVAAAAQATSAFVVMPPTTEPSSLHRRGARQPPLIPDSLAPRTDRFAAPPTHTCTTALTMVAKSGGREILSTDQFETEVLSSTLTDVPVLVFYSAPWCGPCRLSNPVVRDVMKQFTEEIDVVEVCTDDLADVAAEAGVVSIPTIQIFYKGELLDTIVGCVARNVLASAVSKVLEEDVGKGSEEEEVVGEEDS